MSSRYSRPHTPPGPPPSQGSRKSTGRKPPSSSVSSKAPSSRSYDDHHSYDKTYAKSSSSSYLPPKAYSDDKYKSSSVRKVSSEKMPNNSSSSSGGNKYPSKGDTYNSESSREYKSTREVHYPSVDRYNNKDSHLHHHPFLGSSYPGEKTRYSDKYLDAASPPQPYGDTKYVGKKYADEYDPYPPDKSSGRYSTSSSSLRHEGNAYYASASLAPYSPFSSYNSYGAYGSTYGSRGGTGSYGTTDKLNYESDKLPQSSYSNLDKLSQVPLHPRDKLSSGGYSDTKLGATRSRLYPEDTRRAYRDYTPPPACSSNRSPLRGVSSSSYGNYGNYSSPPRSPQRQYLNRYVIGDSVVYGPPGHYPRDLRSTSPRIRPPSPPSPQPLMPRSYSRYPNSPRRYPSGSNRSPPATSSQYRSPSPAARRAASPRRPPSPPSRRPPSPRSPQLRPSYRGNREQSFERARSKDRFETPSKLVML